MNFVSYNTNLYNIMGHTLEENFSKVASAAYISSDFKHI